VKSTAGRMATWHVCSQAVDAFIKKVEGEETEYPNLMDGLKAQLIAEAAVESPSTNQPKKSNTGTGIGLHSLIQSIRCNKTGRKFYD